MNAPTWLPNLLAAAMLAIAAFLGWRLAVARVWSRSADYESDAFQALAALAMAGMLVKWMQTLPRDAWAAVFAAAALWFAGRLLLARGTTWSRSEQGRLLANAAVGLALVYMLLAGVAPSTLSGSTAGQVTMAGMPGMIKDVTIGYPTLGLILAVGAVGYVVVLLDRLSPAEGGAPSAAGTETGTDPDYRPPLHPMDRPGPLILSPLTPRAVECCRAALLATMAYTMLANLV